MDTSETASKVLGSSYIAADRVTNEERMEIVEAVYSQPLIAEVRTLFRRVGEFMDGSLPFHERIPPGLTTFPKGLGVNSVVHLVSLKRLGTHRKMLLLSKPIPKRPLEWAFWTLECEARRGGTQTDVVCSTIEALSREQVIKLFDVYPHLTRELIDVGPGIDEYAKELIDKAYRIGQLGFWVKEVRNRISF